MKFWKRGIVPVFIVLFALAAGGGAVSAQAQMTAAEGSSARSSDAGHKSGTTAEKTGKVEIDYKDNVDGTGPIEGAEFTFYRLNGEIRTEAGRIRTDKDGNAVIILEAGKYEVQETKPAPGHEASSGFRLTVPMKDENGRASYMITAEPKPVRIPDTPESVPEPKATPVPDSVPTSETDSLPAPSVSPDPSSKPDTPATPSPTKKADPEVPEKEEEPVRITTGTIPPNVKKEVIRQKDAKEPIRAVEPAATSDDGNAVFYVVVVGSAAAVAGTMLWICRKGERH